MMEQVSNQSKFDRLLKAVLRYGLLFCIFTPLILLRTFWSPTNFGKAIFFRILIELLLILWVYLLVKRRLLFKIDAIAIMVIVFSASYLLSSAVGVNFGNSIWGGFERMGGFFNYIHFVLFFFMLRSVYQTKSDWSLLINISLGVGFVSIIYGFLQRSSIDFILGGGSEGVRERIFGTIGNPAMFAGYILILLFFSLYMLVQAKRENRRYLPWIYAMFSALAFVAIIMTQVRGAFLALLAGGGVIASGILLRSSNKKLREKILACGIVFVIVLSALFLFKQSKIVTGNRYLNRIVSTSISSVTVNQRLLVWKESVDGIREKPILGWGSGNFSVVHSKYYQPELYRGPGGSIFDRPHNIFLEVIVHQGIIGMIILLLILRLIVKQIQSVYANDYLKKYISVALLLAYVIQALAFFNSVSINLLLAVFIAYVFRDTDLKRTDTSQPSFRKIYFITAAVLVASVFTVYQYSIVPVLANGLSAKAAVEFSKGEYTSGMTSWKETLDKSMPMSYRRDILLNVRPLFSVTSREHQGVLPIDTIDEDSQYIIDELKAHLDINPYDIDVTLALAVTYIARANYIGPTEVSDAITIMDRTLERAPKLIMLLHEKGNLFGIGGSYEEAVNIFEQAYNLNPEYTRSEYYLNKSKILNGDPEGIILMANTFKGGYTETSDLIWFGSYLKSLGEVDVLIDVLEYMSDNNPNLLILLAIAHKDAEDVEASLIVADRILNAENEGLNISKGVYETLSNLYDLFGETEKAEIARSIFKE